MSGSILYGIGSAIGGLIFAGVVVALLVSLLLAIGAVGGVSITYLSNTIIGTDIPLKLGALVGALVFTLSR